MLRTVTTSRLSGNSESPTKAPAGSREGGENGRPAATESESEQHRRRPAKGLISRRAAAKEKTRKSSGGPGSALTRRRQDHAGRLDEGRRHGRLSPEDQAFRALLGDDGCQDASSRQDDRDLGVDRPVRDPVRRAAQHVPRAGLRAVEVLPRITALALKKAYASIPVFRPRTRALSFVMTEQRVSPPLMARGHLPC